MGYKKLDEVMELLSDELDGFNRAVDRLERLTQNVEDININPDTTKIESMLRENHTLEKTKTSQLNESIQNIGQRVSMASLVPKTQLWLHYTIWLASLLILGYLAFKVSRMDIIREKAFAEGKQQTISILQGYFDRYPEHYKSYLTWTEEKDSVPNQK